MNISPIEIKKELARRKHLNFMSYCWRKADEFKIGIHTRGVCDELDAAFNKYRNGVSTYLAILIPNRQGKSDITSRFAPAHFIGEFPEKEIIVTSCSSSLSDGFSIDARSIMQTPEYQELYPSVTLAEGNRAIKTWSVNDGIGKTYWCGLRSGIMGKGASYLCTDDFFASRAEAESAKIREKTWVGFADDCFTRLAPVHIVVVTATPWHVDDLFGRIKKRMKEDSNYPRFKFIKYPAFSPDYPGKKTMINGVEMGTLFPEMYPIEWYLTQKATKSQYSFNAIMMLNPSVRGENMIRTDRIQYMNIAPEGLRWVRPWDLSSSEREQGKEDPDYTVGIRMAVRLVPSAIPGVVTPIIFIDGDTAIRGRWKAATRNNIIKDCAVSENGVRVGTEAFGAYKDAYDTLKEILLGLRHVEDLRLPGSKIAKAEFLVAPFEAGNVYVIYKDYKKDVGDDEVIKRPEFIDDMIDELDLFPYGAHDDICDTLAMGFEMAKNISGELCHATIGMICDDMIEPESQVYHAIIIEGIRAYIVTAQWSTKRRRLHVCKESEKETIEDIVQEVKTKKDSRTICPQNVDSDAVRTLITEFMDAGIPIEVDNTFDPLSSLYFLNTLTDNKTFTLSSKCRNTILAMQNSTDIKDISPYLKSLLYIINNIQVQAKNKTEEAAPKPFTKQKTEYIKNIEYDLKHKDKEQNVNGFYN